MGEAAGESSTRLLLGHLKAKVRGVFAEELKKRGFSVSEASVPAVLRQMALAQQPKVVLCPPGWLGEDDRRDLRLQRINTVEVDAETAAVSDVIALINTAVRQASEQSARVPTPPTAFSRPGLSQAVPIRASTPPLAFLRPRGEGSSSPSQLSRVNTPPAARSPTPKPASTPPPQERQSGKIRSEGKSVPGRKTGQQKASAAKSSLGKIVLAIGLAAAAIAFIAYQLSNV